MDLVSVEDIGRSVRHSVMGRTVNCMPPAKGDSYANL